jgi:hypothetical protein
VTNLLRVNPRGRDIGIDSFATELAIDRVRTRGDTVRAGWNITAVLSLAPSRSLALATLLVALVAINGGACAIAARRR